MSLAGSASSAHAPDDVLESNDLTRLFAALANPERFAMVEVLSARRTTGARGMTISEIAAVIGATRFCVSRHLGILRESGLVHTTWDGNRSVNDLDIEPLRALWDWVDPRSE